MEHMGKSKILRNQVRDHLLRQIHEGKLNAESSINLAELARILGVSVTPIREALGQLEYIKVVKAIPKSGFVLPRLRKEEASNLYSTMVQLEMTALESSSFSEKDIQKLRRRHEQTLTASDPLKRLKARFEFNDALIQNCTNDVLRQLLENLKTRLLFYERLVDSNDEFHQLVINQHEAIIQAIEEHNIPTACLIVKMNRMASLDHVVDQINS